MATVVEIENALKNLTEDGKFQRICDAILVKKGYTQHTALGSQIGTFKTTSGTPDTYFKTSEGKYIFVEYTTKQDGLVAKIIEDIQKCLDVEKTKIPLSDISEIIYFYCSDATKISPENDSKITKICTDVNIKITLNGINQIADDLKFKYPTIAKDYLNLNIDTNQILTYDDFIKNNDTNKYSTPLNLSLISRENEVAELAQALNTYSISVITGAPGVGKTRIALECANNYAQKNDYTLYCIKNNCSPIDDDLVSYLEKPGKYLLFLDDANTWNDQLLKFYKYLENPNYELKFLITARDYTYTTIENITKSYGDFFYKKINCFSKDELSIFLKTFFNIINEDYVNKIYEISKGNPRLAYMAGKIAIEKNGYNKLYDSTKIFEQYYAKFNIEITFLEDESLFHTLGLLAFMKAIRLDKLDEYESILPCFALTKERFLKSIEIIEKLEIINIDYNVIRYSDESFSNYILYCYYLKNKTLSISDCINTFFQKDRNLLLDNLNILTRIFINEETKKYLKEEIKKSWLIFEESESYYEFLESFYEIDLDKTFLYIKQEIDKIPNINQDSPVEAPNQINYLSNHVIKLLSKLNETAQYEKAFLFLLEIYKKNSELRPQIIYTLTHDWSINRKSLKNGYKRELSIITILIKESDNYILNYLFIKIAENLLSLVFNSTEATGKFSIKYFTIPMICNSQSKELRETIWKQLQKLINQEKYVTAVIELLQSYSSGWNENIDKALLEFDKPFVDALLDNLNYDEIIKYQIYSELLRRYKHFGIISKIDTNLISSFEVKVYTIFSKEHYELTIEQEREIQRQNIIEFINNDKTYSLCKLVSALDKIAQLKQKDQWSFSEGIRIYINQLDNNDLLRFFIEYLKTKYLDLYPSMILKPLFETVSDSLIYRNLKKTNRSDKNNWIYCYFESLPENKCNRLNYIRLLHFFTMKNDVNIKACSNRNLIFLKKFLPINKNVFISVSKKIIKKEKYNPYITSRYFELLFNPYSDMKPNELYSYFYGNMSLLKKIYFLQKTHDYSIDYNETFIKYFISQDKSWINEYVQFIKSLFIKIDKIHFPELAFFWEIDEYLDFFTELFDICCSEKQGIFLLFPFNAKDLFIDKDNKTLFQERSTEWFSFMINRHIHDREKLKFLFNLIIELPENDRIKFYSLFLSKNKSYEDFKVLPLESSHWSWSGSEIPVLVQRKNYLIKILDLFHDDIYFIEHKNYINSCINYIDNRIDEVKKNEFMEKLLNPDF